MDRQRYDTGTGINRDADAPRCAKPVENRNPKTRRPIAMHQLCAIARSVIEPDPTMTDSDWKEATRLKAARQGYDTIPPQMLASAMNRVEHAIKRPLPAAPVSRHEEAPPAIAPFTRAEARAILGRLEAMGALKSMPKARPLTQRQAECRRALAIITEGIVEQVRRCDDAERAGEVDE